jgi:hypothetical protein
MGDNFQKRAVATTTPAEPPEFQVRFESQRFNALVFDKGYEVWLDRAYRCPCSITGAGQPLVSCDNCLGVGWIFTDRSETRIAVQGIKADVKYENWSKTTAGTARITARAIDKLAFMDRIILKDVEGYYNEIIRVRNNGTTRIGYTEYPIIEIEDIFLFDTDKTPLKRLVQGTDYTIEKESKIILTPAASTKPAPVLSVRYRHYMTYHIIDMNRDIMKVREKGCLMPEEMLKEMPVAGLARKAHYLFDNMKYEEEDRLIEN